jgi:hypothetical protein
MGYMGEEDELALLPAPVPRQLQQDTFAAVRAAVARCPDKGEMARLLRTMARELEDAADLEGSRRG